MNIIALILFVPATALTLLVLYVYALKSILKSFVSLLALVMGFADIGGPQGYKSLSEFGRVTLSITGIWLTTLVLCVAIIVPISASVYFYLHGRYGVVVGILVIALCISTPFLPRMLSLARNNGNIMPGADPSSYEVLTYSVYAKDATHVFNTYSKTIVQGADPATFEVDARQPRNYAKDKNNVYDDKSNTLTGADPKSFTTVGMYGYAKDATHVWWHGKEIPNADPGTFIIIKTATRGEIGKDAQYVYDTIHPGKLVNGEWAPLDK